ncbi:MAG: hypothetical protein JW849_00200 [Phycisphaerae bacterium]|nr:hypothetical protein [Phycisphaerae bacterium]
MNRRKAILLGVLGGCLAAVGYYSYDNMISCRKAALASANDITICRKMAGSMEQYMHQPMLASEHELLATQTNGLIEKAATQAGISKRNLIRITPEPARRIEDSPYKDKPSHILLRDVTLKQMVPFIHNLLSAGLHARAIRLASPKPEDTGSLWTMEITMSYLVYDPRTME